MVVQTTFLSTLFAASAHASPIVLSRATNNTNPFIFTNYNGLNFTQMDITLPNVTLFATGKFVFRLTSRLLSRLLTFSGRGSNRWSSRSSMVTTGYTAGAVSILTLITVIPESLNTSNVARVQISKVGSLLLNMSKSTNLSATIPRW
jgi:L-asparaginase